MRGYVSMKLRKTVEVNGQEKIIKNALGYLACWPTFAEAVEDAGSEDLVLSFDYEEPAAPPSEEGQG